MSALARQRDIHLRLADQEGDFVHIRRIARQRFDRIEYGGAAPSQGDQSRCIRRTPQGPICASVATNRDLRIVGYIFYQMRKNGDLYICEIASEKFGTQDRLSGVGAALLGRAMEDGLRFECTGHATLNALTDQIGRTPITFYKKFGFVSKPYALAYRANSNGLFSSTSDHWMMADIGNCYRLIVRHFQGAIKAPSLAIGARGPTVPNAFGAGLRPCRNYHATPAIAFKPASESK